MALNKNALKHKSSEARTYGLATVKVGKSNVKITFKDGESYKFPLDEMPKRPRLATDSEDLYMVVLSPDKDTIEKIGPAEGHVLAKCTDFNRPDEDSDPEPIDDEYIDKKTQEKKPFKKFIAFFTVLSGKYKGCVIPHFLRYKFVDDGQGYAMWDGNPAAKNAIHLPRLEEFCVKTGCVDEPIEWPEDENILPELLDRILKADRTVDLVIKDGYISTILGSDFEDAEDDEDDTPAKPAKATKKAAAKDDFEDADEDETPKVKAKPAQKRRPVVDDDDDDDV